MFLLKKVSKTFTKDHMLSLELPLMSHLCSAELVHNTNNPSLESHLVWETGWVLTRVEPLSHGNMFNQQARSQAISQTKWIIVLLHKNVPNIHDDPYHVSANHATFGGTNQTSPQPPESSQSMESFFSMCKVEDYGSQDGKVTKWSKIPFWYLGKVGELGVGRVGKVALLARGCILVCCLFM